MTDILVLWLIAMALFLVADLAWLTWLGRSFYTGEIGGLLRERPVMHWAALFYVLYVTCLLVLVIWPAFLAASVFQALAYGAVFGLAAYGTYDLTNLAVLKGFTTRIALIDLAWGTMLTAVVSALAVLLGRIL